MHTLRKIDEALQEYPSLRLSQSRIPQSEDSHRRRLSEAFGAGRLVLLSGEDGIQEQASRRSGAPGAGSDRGKARGAPPAKTVGYRIKIPPGTSSKEEFRRYAEVVIFGRVVNHDWQADPGASRVYANIARHVGTEVVFQVEASELARFGRSGDAAAKAGRQAGERSYATLSPAERDRINEEIDRRYYASVGSPFRAKIGPRERGKIAIWNSLKQQVMVEKRQLDALPPELRKFLLDTNAVTTIEPRDFEQALRIASKISTLSSVELAEYKSRVTAATTDWSDLEASVDRFISECRGREAGSRQLRTLEVRLFNLEALYQRYLDYCSMLKANAVSAQDPMGAGLSLATQISIEEMRADLEAGLARAGFPGGITDFENLIRGYERSFEQQTLAIAKVMLDQYSHLLWTQKQRYLGAAATGALYDQVNQTRASADFAEADRIRMEHATGMVLTPEEMADQAYWVGKFNDALARGQQKVGSLAGEHPLIGESDFPRERLARASQGEVQPLMLGFIAARERDIATTRRNLEDTPRMIYGLDALIEASIQAQNIQKGTIYERIIRDHIRDVHWEEAIPDIVLAVIAVAAGLFTGGVGTAAVLADATVFGIGTYQAIEEFRRYERRSAAFGARLLSDDPSIAWVIVAVIGAGIDAAALARALPKLKGALQAFNAGAEADDVAALGKKLEKLSEVEESIRKAILRAAKAEVEARAAWKRVLRPLGLSSYVIPGADYFGRLVFAVYCSANRGMREFQLFVKSREAIALIGDVGKLSLEELTALKSAYLKAVEEAEATVAHGKALGMTDDEVYAFMNLRDQTKGMTAEQVAKEMEAWKAVRSSGIPFGFDTAEQFENFKAVAVKRLKKARYDDVDGILQGSAASGISYDEKIPFRAQSDLDVGLAGNSLFEKARKLGYPLKGNPKRIGPLKPEQIEELGLGSMHQALTEAAGGRVVNLLLFSNRKAAFQGIAGVNPESILLK